MRVKLSDLAEVYDEQVNCREWVEWTTPSLGKAAKIFLEISLFLNISTTS
jgi:hypothetical protein